ncbi:MAG: acyl-CoA thioesterase [Nitrososphaeria archaeon]|jgi:acyl-CoA thioester hydrolase
MAVKEIYQTSVKVYDTDFQGIAHYASYYRFYTDAITYFSEKVFGDTLESLSYRGIWFVVVESFSKYHRPAKIGDTITVEVTAELLSLKAIKYSFRIFRDKDFLTEGYLVMVCVDPRVWKSTEIPGDLVEKLKKAEQTESSGSQS